MPDYVRARSLHEALDIRAARDVAVIAGGTDIYPAWVSRRAWGDPTHKDILDISGVNKLRGVSQTDTHWQIGALTTWTDIIEAPLPPLFSGLKAAARAVGGVQVQNRGTIAGNICTASPAGDGIPCLLALDAEVEMVSSAGLRRLPISYFQTGYRTTALQPDELVTAILVPKHPPATRGHFVKLGARAYLVISIAMVSAVIGIDPAGRINLARVAVGACSETAARLTALEKVLIGQPALMAPVVVNSAYLQQLKPIDDIRASAAYRLQAAEQLVRDCLKSACSAQREWAA
jgi:xanthine dehydrogenase small subunit